MIVLLFWGMAEAGRADILWSDLGATLVYQTGVGSDILGGGVKRDESSTDTLYFKFHVDPLSDTSTEEYFAAFELYDRGEERLGVGNALKAWAYSAFTSDGPGDVKKDAEYIDLHSSRPEASGHGNFFSYENPHRGLEATIIFKVQYVAGGDDEVTVWLNPDLGPGAVETAQPDSLITRFKTDASFDEIHLRHGGGGGGWIFSDMEIATSFSDFVASSNDRTNGIIPRLIRGEQPVSFQSWQREQGLPQNSVRAIAQTSDGYLWVGNDDGVASFDGARFVSYGLREGLNSGPVQTLFGDETGALWIGTTGGGLTCWAGGKFTTYTTRDGLPGDSITALAEDDAGQLWVGTEAGLAVREKSGKFVQPEFKGKTIATLFKDRAGTMWLGVKGAGVFHFVGGRFVALTDSSVDTLLQDPHCLIVDRQGRIWIAVGNDVVLCRDGNHWQPYRISSHQSELYFRTLAEGGDGAVWAGSPSEGLFQLKDGKIQAITAASGLSDTLTESLLVDRDGGLWVGTHGGLNRLHRRTLFAFGQKEGLGYGAVQGLAEVGPGTILAAKANDGLYVWEGGNFRRLNGAGLALAGPQINSLLVARDGSCWMAGARALLHFSGTNWATDSGELFPDVHGTALFEDRDGGVWVGTDEGGIWRRWKGVWLAESNYWQTHPVTVIGQDHDDWMWIGSEGGGLERFKGELHSHIGKQNGLLSDSIRTLYVDSEGTVWIGTAGAGLSRWKNGRIAAFTTHEGLPDNTISEILEDGQGRLWLGSGRGIACVSKLELEELAMGKIPAVYPLVYGRPEGMPSEECTGGYSPAGLKSRSGLLWFSTLKGIVVADPRPQIADSTPPVVALEEVLLDGTADPQWNVPSSVNKGLAGGGGAVLHIPPGRHRIEFRYTGISFDSAARVRFRYRLDGLDNDWVEAGTRRSALYNYVPPGHYAFHVAACNADGAWVEGRAALALAAEPHFWQRWWVQLLAGVCLLIAVAGVALALEKRRSWQRLERLEQEKALEKERTRIAQDLHDEMGAKLCRISFLSEHARRSPNLTADVRRQISSISDSSREVLTSLDEIVWAINPKNDMLEHLASYLVHYAREYFQETGIECDMDMPARLPACPLSSQFRHHVLLAVHEAFTNVLKHSHASRARVCISCGGGGLDIVVSDNGSGFKPGGNGNGANGGQHDGTQGNGLRNMHQRLTEIGGGCLIESVPGRGTIIRFTLPLAAADAGEAAP